MSPALDGPWPSHRGRMRMCVGAGVCECVCMVVMMVMHVRVWGGGRGLHVRGRDLCVRDASPPPQNPPQQNKAPSVLTPHVWYRPALIADQVPSLPEEPHMNVVFEANELWHTLCRYAHYGERVLPSAGEVRAEGLSCLW
jgi:hypothetical protein